MKTPEEIKKGLAECTRLGGCAACPYFDRGIAARCTPVLAADALAYIRELEAQLAQVKAERDRYWQYIKGMECESCSGDCDKCTVTKDGFTGWEWSGKEKAE